MHGHVCMIMHVWSYRYDYVCMAICMAIYVFLCMDGYVCKAFYVYDNNNNDNDNHIILGWLFV